MREIIAIIVIYIAQRMTDLESGGFAFALSGGYRFYSVSLFMLGAWRTVFCRRHTELVPNRPGAPAAAG